MFEAEDKKEIEFGEGEGIEDFDEDIMPITTDGYLYLSGTPFRAIASGEFIEEQIFNWTYSDEQRAKQEWKGADNPYAALPRMVLLTYQLPDAIREIAMQGEFNEFDLNVFFSASGIGEKAKFKYQDEVQKWLDLIRGAFHGNNRRQSETRRAEAADAVLGCAAAERAVAYVLVPAERCVVSCHAKPVGEEAEQVLSGLQGDRGGRNDAGIGVAALPPVQEAMDDPLKTKTITLSCGKLTTGVTVKPWTGILMLRNSSSPETYFQAAFRVQSPWTVRNPDGASPNREQVIKEECYVFDFAPDRALRQIADYSCR